MRKRTVAERSRHTVNVVRKFYAVRIFVAWNFDSIEITVSYFPGCELNGTIYDNGDKIVDPENPCEVCVCRGKFLNCNKEIRKSKLLKVTFSGGEINCNALTCYSRNDCKNVTYAPGVCCPEYANCPPLGMQYSNWSKELIERI